MIVTTTTPGSLGFHSKPQGRSNAIRPSENTFLSQGGSQSDSGSETVIPRTRLLINKARSTLYMVLSNMCKTKTKQDGFHSSFSSLGQLHEVFLSEQSLPALQRFEQSFFPGLHSRVTWRALADGNAQTHLWPTKSVSRGGPKKLHF